MSAPAPAPQPRIPAADGGGVGTRQDIVVYTAVAGGYDAVREPEVVSERCRYVCFSDAPAPPASRVWLFRRFDELLPDPARTSRKPKLLAHRYFPECEYSVWIDANLSVVGDLAELVERHLAVESLALFRHPDGRACLYEEAEACIRLRKDREEVIRAQVEGYRARGYPPGRPVPACTAILRRHRDRRVAHAMEQWWEELRRGSRRDQLSFPFVAWTNALRLAPIGGDVRRNPWLRWRPHTS